MRDTPTELYKAIELAILIISTSLLLWASMSICTAKIASPVSNAFENSIVQKPPLEHDTKLEEINVILENRWWKSSRENKEWRPLNIGRKWHDPAVIENLPDSFDPRDRWPFCDSLNNIYDQGACGSCWVFGSVSAITDRYCIAWNGTKQFQASPEDALTCSDGGSCQGGGSSFMVYVYWENRGIVSGGAYDTRDGCKPYAIPPCKIHDQGMPCYMKDFVTTPQCETSCISGYPSSYNEDRQYASSIDIVEGEEQIKAELYSNGPVTATMDVFEDFITYKGGVYRHASGEFWYGHAFKLMGWGEENGVKYWLAANSWNVEWGERGFFRIVRGENHCGIEDFVIAGQPKL